MTPDDISDVQVGMGGRGSGKYVGKTLHVSFKIQSEDKNHAHSNGNVLTEL